MNLFERRKKKVEIGKSKMYHLICKCIPLVLSLVVLKETRMRTLLAFERTQNLLTS